MADTPTFGRYAELPLDRMTQEQQEGYRFLVKGPRGRLPGPYKIWVHNPKLVHAAAPLGQHFTPGASSLSEREREIAVVVITSKWHSAYPNAAHEKRGKEVGLPAAAVEAIIAGLPTSFEDAREQCVYECALALASERIGWEVQLPRASMFVWARYPEEWQRRMGSIDFAMKLLEEAEVAVSPGRGFGEAGEGYLRLALVENEHRLRQAVRQIARCLRTEAPAGGVFGDQAGRDGEPGA